jgi:site-specific recombinase XerD
MGSEDLIDDYMSYLSALGRRSLRSIESSLRSADDAPELLLGLADATERELLKYLGRKREDGSQHFSPGTKHTYAARITGFFNWAVRVGECEFNPMADIPPLKVPKGKARPVVESDVVALTRQSDGWLKVAVVLAGWAGLRCCEIAPLLREDVTPDLITVWHGKGGKARVVPTHERIWRTVAPLPAGNLMETTGGRPDADWLSRTSRHRLRRMGLAAGGLHRLRHRLATQMLATDSDIREVQEVLGHDSLQSTQIYTHVPLERLKRRIAAVPDVPDDDDLDAGLADLRRTDQAARRG